MTPPDRDPASIAARVFRPHRPALAAARAGVARCARPERAWAALGARGLVPPLPAGVTARLFMVKGSLAAQMNSGSVPRNVNACVAFASDPAGVAEAERLAAVLLDRLTPWLGPVLPRIVWTVGRELPGYPQRRRGLILGAVRAGIDLWALLESGPREVAAVRRAADDLVDAELHASVREEFLGTLADSVAWQIAARAGASVPAGFRASGPLAALPDAYGPLLDLWATGYAVERVTPQGIVLMAPPGERRAG